MIEYVKAGFEFWDKYSNNKDVKEALYDNIKRELNFNLEIMEEINKPKNKDITQLVLLFKTDFYDYIQNSSINIKSIKTEKTIDVNKLIDDERLTDKRFRNWVKNIDSDIELIEKFYLKITILKSLVSVGINKREVNEITRNTFAVY